jgi:hypothetical protein
MSLWSRPRIRHPLFPGLPIQPAAGASGKCIALIGDFAGLLEAHSRGVRPSRAIFVERGIEQAFLQSEERDLLWNLFAVPVLGVLVDSHGTTLGYECEAQDGLHVSAHFASSRGVAGLEQSLCNCGRTGPRILAEASEPHSLPPHLAVVCRATT